MTIELFMYLFTLGSAFNSLLTQAVKKAFNELPSNFLALGDALVVGLGGSICAYCILGIPCNVQNIICAILMALCIWIGSMCGYDKIVQLIRQTKG